jgi:hypothetical protein
MAPALVWDALVALPDWSHRSEDAASLVRLFVDPALVAAEGSRPAAEQSHQQQAEASLSNPDERQSSPADRNTDAAPIDQSKATESSSLPAPSPAWAAWQRLRMALELMQVKAVGGAQRCGFQVPRCPR